MEQSQPHAPAVEGAVIPVEGSSSVIKVHCFPSAFASHFLTQVIMCVCVGFILLCVLSSLLSGWRRFHFDSPPMSTSSTVEMNLAVVVVARGRLTVSGLVSIQEIMESVSSYKPHSPLAVSLSRSAGIHHLSPSFTNGMKCSCFVILGQSSRSHLCSSYC